MNRIHTLALAVALLGSAIAQAQTAPPADPPQRPRPGVILDSPAGGRITDAPTEPPKATPQTPDATGSTIERFEAVGNGTVASDTIRVYLGIDPGEPYDPVALQRNFLNLWQTGLFDDIRIEALPGDAGGVVVRVTVKERPRIGAVEFRGNKELATAKINEALEREKIDLHLGSTIEQTLVKRAAEAIRRGYTEGGFEGVQVDTITEDMPEPGEKRIVFVIAEGIKAKVASIDFTGNKHFSDRRLRSEMKDVKKHNIITWVRKKNLYIPSKLDEDLERVRNYYQDHGYQNVQFGEPQVITVGKNTRRPRVKLVIPVTEGEIHTFGEVTVSGNKVFTNEQIIGDWPLKKGDTIRRKPIANRIDAFGEAYRMRGYIYAYVDPEYVQRENNVVDVNIRVFEGDQFRLGRLEFEGNATTKDKVLRREIFLEEGQIMDMETFKVSLQKLGQLGYFKVTENPDFKVNQDSKTVDITVKGIEEGRNDIQFGGGYSEGGGFFVQAQFATRNFLGEGDSIGLSYQKGSRTNFFNLSYADPWFMDTPNSLGISVFNRETTYPESFGYQQRGKGGTLAYGYRLRRWDSISFMYGYERAHSYYETVESPDPNGNIPLPTISDFVFTTSTIIPSYRFDSRDNPYDTTRGTRLSASIGFTGGPLGGTIDMLKPQLSVTKFFRLSRKSSVSVNADWGFIHPLDDKDCVHRYDQRTEAAQDVCIPIGERFFVGGEFSVRGFEYGTLGPYEQLIAGRIAQPVGGYKQQVYNAEYIYKVNDPIRLVLFADAGYSYSEDESIDLSKLRYSVGAEMRLFLPVFQFPLRFIFAMNPQEKEGDKFESVQFTIGNTF
ncbi:MAG: outer membrane protein assembly factor BamA [Thermoanaerobaculia bacterium]